MDFEEYQKRAAETAFFPEDSECPFLGLAGEAGEVCEARKKMIRDNDTQKIHDLFEELGDVLWYVAIICNRFGWNLKEVASHNIDKLQNRHG